MIADIDGLTVVRVEIPPSADETPMLTLMHPETEGEPARSFTIAGLEAIINLRNAIDEEIALLGQRIELIQDDVPQ
jgi:hypothetical protein